VLVFVKTKHGANRLAQQLSREGVQADAIHGNKSQNARTRALADFKAGEMRVLVATDIAARGLDIEALPHVVNYDLPHVAEDYVHRIGRTGRAGAEGEAVTLVSHEDRPLMAAIEKMMNRKVESRVIAGFEPGTASSRPPETKQPHRQPQQQRRGQPRQGQQRQQQPRQQQPRRPARHNGRPHRLPEPAPAHSAEREAQIQEARARMREEGEAPAPQPKRSFKGFVGALLGRKST
jgi:ATP-dependent RNA helicase RhlE